MFFLWQPRQSWFLGAGGGWGEAWETKGWGEGQCMDHWGPFKDRPGDGRMRGKGGSPGTMLNACSFDHKWKESRKPCKKAQVDIGSWISSHNWEREWRKPAPRSKNDLSLCASDSSVVRWASNSNCPTGMLWVLSKLIFVKSFKNVCFYRHTDTENSLVVAKGAEE